MRYRPSLSLISFFCLVVITVSTVQGDYLLVKDVLSTSGGHLESGSYLLDYSTGQTAVGMSQGSSLPVNMWSPGMDRMRRAGRRPAGSIFISWWPGIFQRRVRCCC